MDRDPADIQAFRDDGVLLLRGVFKDWVEVLRAGIEKNIAAPSWRIRRYHPDDSPTEFFQDYLVWDRIDEYRDFIFRSPAAAIAGQLMGAATVRMFHEHVLVKEPGTTVATPWHQDMPYYCVEGAMTCSLWVALDRIARDTAVEFVAGSHRWGREFRPERQHLIGQRRQEIADGPADMIGRRPAVDLRQPFVDPDES